MVPVDAPCTPQSGVGTMVYFRETDPCNPVPEDTPFVRLGKLLKVDVPGLKATYDQLTYLDPEFRGWKQSLPTHEKEATGFGLTASHAGKQTDGVTLVKRAAGKSILLDCKIQSSQSSEYLEFKASIEELSFSSKESSKTDTVTIKFTHSGPISGVELL